MNLSEPSGRHSRSWKEKDAGKAKNDTSLIVRKFTASTICCLQRIWWRILSLLNWTIVFLPSYGYNGYTTETKHHANYLKHSQFVSKPEEGKHGHREWSKLCRDLEDGQRDEFDGFNHCYEG